MMTIFDWLLLGPSYWPQWLRRIFLMTLPVSGPLYLFFTGAFVMFFCMVSFVKTVPLIPMFFMELWRKP